MPFILEILLLGGLAGLAPSSSEPEKSISKSFLNTLPDAIAEATLLDAEGLSYMALLGLMPWKSIPVYFAAAVSGYSFRKTCKDYSNGGSNLYFNTFVCGTIGGALKYGSRAYILGGPDLSDKLLATKRLRGAINAGLYEYWGASIDTLYNNGNYTGFAGALVAIETLDSILAMHFEKSWTWENTRSAAFEGIAGGSGLAKASASTYTWYASSIKDSVRSWTHSNTTIDED